MANAASKDRVSADMKPTDYRGAVKRMEAIAAKTAKQKGIAAEIGDIYDKVAGVHGVDKRAAKVFHALSKLTPEDRLLVFRDIDGLMSAAGYDEDGADLVDKSQERVVHMRFGRDRENAEGDDGESIDEEIEAIAADGSQVATDGFTEASEEELAQQQGRPQGAEEAAAERAKEAFTGDNSDLKPE